MTNQKVCDVGLSQKLEVLQRIRSHLLTIIGHEFWTPLSTSQVCLESLAEEQLIPSDCRQIILETAFKDVERLRHLIQTTLSISDLNSEQDSELEESKQDCELEPDSEFESKSIEQHEETKDFADASPCWKTIALADILDRTQPRVLQQNPCKLFLTLEQNIDLYCALSKDKSSGELQNSNSCDDLEILEHTRKNLIAIVGHELRTPLCTIQICLESLIREPTMAPEYQQVMLEIALGDIERLRQLIQDFFLLLRLENGQLYHRPDFIEFQEVIDIALSSFRANVKECHLPQVTAEIPPNLPKIQVDGDRIVEALIKLIDNAYKFTDIDGTINVQVKINQAKVDDSESVTGNSKTMLEVIVADTGRGIAPDNLEAVFNHFYQEEDSLRRSVGGTGIGLAICRYIVHSLGGEIWASSEGKHKGTQIHFTVPLETTLD
ncbi:MAG: ATP-binding protein [Mastigocoleus sp. MO_167.B18]|nr:ATP-binding protein [Mastigocoleus sp. MO_167.B18]